MPDPIVSMSQLPMADHLRAHLRLIGCTCSEVELDFWTDADDMPRCTIKHDDDCIVLRRIDADAN
jgi:hypothetical protein